MIEDPLLHLLVSRLNELRRPGVNADEADQEHQQLDRMLAEAAPGEMSWHDHAMNAYVRLDRRDFADVPSRTHHWFLERLPAGPWLREARPDFLANLYDLVDPVGRFLLVRAVSRSVRDVGFDLFAPVLAPLSRLDDRDVRNRRARELIDLLVDVWLSEGTVSGRNEGASIERRLPPWFRDAIFGAIRSPFLGQPTRAVLRERAGTLDRETARMLIALADLQP